MMEVFIIVDNRTHSDSDTHCCYDTREKAEKQLEEIRVNIIDNSYRHSMADEEELMDDMHVSKLEIK